MTKSSLGLVFPFVGLLLVASTVFAGQTDQIRTDLDTILAHDQSIDAVMGRNAAEALVHARNALAVLSDEELELLAPYAASIASLKDRTILLADHVLATAGAARAQGQARSAGFPDAAYYTDSLCTGARNDTGGMKIAWNVYWAAETALAAAQYVCLTDILGENTSAACIPLAVAVGVASQVIDNYDFCDDDVDSSEIGASYLRLGHIHDDMALVQETLDQASIEQIEVDLARRRYYVAEYIIPASSEGKLEQVRAVVVDVMSRMVAAGVDIRRAPEYLASADAYYAAGDWKGAYRALGIAYRQAVLVP
jgi:hypothetical protein